MKRLLVMVMLLVPCATLADEPISQEARANAEEQPLELDPIDVTGEGWSLQQETTLRMLRSALGKPKSQRQEDRDVWVCWIDEATGSNFNYLNCARNGDLWALERPFGLAGPTMPIGGYGTILRSERPVNKSKLNRVLANLNGSAEFDQEFLNMRLQGQEPPRDIPDTEEMDQFAEAYRSVSRLARRGASEDRQIRAIRAAGLSLDRYNRIATLTETYQSIENDIATRLGN